MAVVLIIWDCQVGNDTNEMAIWLLNIYKATSLLNDIFIQDKINEATQIV